MILAEVPRQGVRGYELVVWGEAAATTRHVIASHDGGRARAAVFAVTRMLARQYGVREPFSVFIVELPVEAACGEITLEAVGAQPEATETVAPRLKLCEKVRESA